MLEVYLGLVIGSAVMLAGVYLGWRISERAHNQAHNLSKFDQPDRPVHRTYIPDTPEARIDRAAKKVEQGFREDTIVQGITELKAMYKDEGVHVPSDKTLRTEVELMLNASTQGESKIE